MARGGHPKSGPPPLDAETRAARGSRFRPRHENVGQGVGAAGLLSRPKNLGRFGAAEWTRLMKLLNAEGRLSMSDRPLLEVAARTYQSARELAAAREQLVMGSAEWASLKRSERLEWGLHSKLLNDLCLSPAT